MNLKKLVTSLFLVSAFSFVNVSCTNPGTTPEGKVFTATLNGTQEVPPNDSKGQGTATLTLSGDEKTATVTYEVSGLSGPETGAHIHGPAAAGKDASVVFPLTAKSTTITLDAIQLSNLKSGLYYVNVHTEKFVPGEVRGWLKTK